MDTKSLDELRSKLASRVQLYDHLHHVCTHGGYFANIAYVAPGELFEMLTAAALPFDSAALLALASSLEQFFALPPILSVHGSRRLALELQWWLKQRSAPEYDAAIVENRLSTSGVDGQAAVLLPMRPLHIKQVFVLPSLPAQPSPAATCRVMDAAARNAGLRIGHPALEVLDLLGVQWAHHADVVNSLAHAFHVLMQFAQQMDAGLQIAWGSHAPSEGAQKDDPATAAHRQRMTAACASVQAFDTYIQSALVQPVLDLLRGVASTKLSCLVGPLLHTQLRQGGGGHQNDADPPVAIPSDSKAAAHTQASPESSAATQSDPQLTDECTATPAAPATPQTNAQAAPTVHPTAAGSAHCTMQGGSQLRSVPLEVVAAAFSGVGWHPRLAAVPLAPNESQP